jgi:hypothetical protein
MYDLIGDIHGHSDELLQVLKTLGYQKHRGVYGNPERKMIFLGDFIDRGPQIRQVLETVRPMIEEGKTLAVMGNHEMNALAYHTEDANRPGQFLRDHGDKNVCEHRNTVEQLKPDELRAYLKWFRTLPLWLDLDGLRVVHACWDDQPLAGIDSALQEHRGVSAAFLELACRKVNRLYAQVDVVLKGREATLPPGYSFFDKEGQERKEMRTRW